MDVPLTLDLVLCFMLQFSFLNLIKLFDIIMNVTTEKVQWTVQEAALRVWFFVQYCWNKL